MILNSVKDFGSNKKRRKPKDDKRKLTKLVESHKFDLFIMFIILCDAVVLGFMTSNYIDVFVGNVLFVLDRLFMGIFIAEMLMKLYVYKKGFFKNGWNVFDFVIVAISSVPFASAFIIFRTFRIFRLLKYFGRFSILSGMFDIFVKLLPNFVALLVFLSVIFYSFAIIGVSLYGDVFKDFDCLGSALFVLLQAFTLDGWASTIARPVMSVYPDAWLYFSSFISLSLLVMMSFLMSAVSKTISIFKR